MFCCSVIIPPADAVGSVLILSLTRMLRFGSMVYSQSTGIILNNELADFCMKRSNKKIFPGELHLLLAQGIPTLRE